MGALLGFLFFNFNPARIFMGDSGSYYLGFMIATTSLAGASQKASTAVALLVPIVALGMPIFDTLFSMVRRSLERRPLFAPDRGHIHHRLVDMGLTQRRAVLLLYGVSVVLTIGAVAISLGRTWQVGFALLLASATMIALVRFAGYFDYVRSRSRQLGGPYDQRTERLRRLVLRMPELTQRAAGEAQVWDLLATVAQQAALTRVQVLAMPEGRQVFLWETGQAADRVGELTRARFCIGPEESAKSEVEFAWLGEVPRPSPQAAMLLQLVVDFVEAVLTQLGSDLAPGERAAAETGAADRA
jgi:UDP-GlcNAc:undecaprenyl-phosphate GlcNAc-1-phosphate transferase